MKYKELLDLIKSSKRILITSHLSPDPDAIGSSLFVYNILKENFKDKELRINIEGGIGNGLKFLNNANEVSDKEIIEIFNEFTPDLLIITDVNRFNRVSINPEFIEKYIKRHDLKVAMVEHHGLEHDTADIFINNKENACCEEVYKVFYEDLELKLPDGYQEMIAVGILGDTGNMTFPKESYKETFRILLDLMNAGLVVDSVLDKMASYLKSQLLIVSELLRNVVVEKEYVYSYISDEYIKENVLGKMEVADFKSAKNLFVNFYVKRIEGKKWGFIVTQDPRVLDKKVYGGSFRSSKDGIDSRIFARLLNGEGHALASGFSLEASSLEEAIKIVQEVIKNNLDRAIASGKSQ